MRVGYVIPAEGRGFYRWRWPIALTAVTVTALVLAVLAALGPRVVVYPTTDFAHLPISTTTSTTPAVPQSCVSIQHVNGSPKLVGEAYGSLAAFMRRSHRRPKQAYSISICVYKDGWGADILKRLDT